MTKISGFQNRIDASILHYDINEGIENIKFKNNELFHPINIKNKIDNNFFSIIKLRHKGLNQNYLNKNSIMSYLINKNGLYVP
jgi:uncharacterized membrane protein